MADIIRSKVDSDTYYTVSSNHISIHRNGDEMKILCSRLDEISRIFVEEIRTEMKEVLLSVNQRTCPICGTSFVRHKKNQKYCCGECSEAGRLQSIADKRETERKEKEQKAKAVVAEPKEKEQKKGSQLNTLAREARSRGMSYGQLQAMKYMQTMQGVNVK